MLPASIECVCCSASIPVDADDPRWSVRTEQIDSVECVVERHLSLVCPACGRSEVGFNPAPNAPDGGEFPARLFNLVVVPVDPPEPVA